MGRQQDRLARPLDSAAQNTGIARKTGQRIGVQHEGAVLRIAPQRLQSEVSGSLSHPCSRAHHEGVLAGIAQDQGEVGGAVAGGQHDGGEMGGVDPQRITRARQRHQPSPDAEGGAGAQTCRARGPGAARKNKSVAARIFVAPYSRDWQKRPPEIRRIGEGLGADRVQHSLWGPDVSQMGFAAENPSGQEKMPGLEAEEGHGCARHDRGAPHRARIAIKPGGNVDGDHRSPARPRPEIDPLDKGPRLAIEVPGKPCPEEAIDDEASSFQINRQAGPHRPRPTPGGLSGVPPEAGRLAQQMDPHAKPALPQQPCGDKAIATIVARTAQDHDLAPLRRKPDRAISHRRPRALHQGHAGNASPYGKPVGLRHFRSSQQFQFAHGDMMERRRQEGNPYGDGEAQLRGGIDYDRFLKLKSLMVGGREIELKFLASPAGLEAVLAMPQLAPLCDAQGHLQVSTYFDTPDCALQKAGFILRLREVGGQLIQTVKQEGASLERGEWEAALDAPVIDLDLAAQSPLGKILADADLRSHIGPIFTTRFTRRKAEVTFARAVVEVAIDEGVVIAGQAHAPIFEIELELKSGRRSGLFALARKLVSLAPVSFSLISKGERGYRLAEGVWGAPVKMTPPPLSAKMSAAEAFAAIAHGCLRQMMLNAPAFDNGQEIEAVHQTRVAIRRLRAALALYRPLIADEVYPRLATDLKWLSDHLGATRDIDVLLTETVLPTMAREPDAPGLADLAAFIGTRQAASRKVLREAMNAPRCRKLTLNLLLWVEGGPWRRTPLVGGQEPESLKSLLARRLRSSRKKLTAMGQNLEALPEAELHDLRIRAKKLRYQAAFFDALASEGKAAKRYRSFVNALEKIQESLGTVHDAEATAAFLEEQARNAVRQGESHDPLVLFAAGRLAGAHPDRAALVARASKALAKALATKPFWTKL